MKPSERELNCILFAERYLNKSKYDILKYFYSKSMQAKRRKYKVTPFKTFGKLWNDFGLSELSFWDNNSYKIECVKYWVEQLYPFKINIDLILNEIHEQQTNDRKEAKKKEPGLICLLQDDPIDVLVIEIDKRFGSYDVLNASKLCKN